MSTSPTPAWQLVTRREISTRLTDRNFVIGTGLTLVLLIGAMLLPALMGGDAAHYRVAVTEAAGQRIVQQTEGAFEATPNPLGSNEPPTIEANRVPDRAAAEATVRSGDADAALVLSGREWQLLTDGAPEPELATALTQTVQQAMLARNAAAAGVTLAELSSGTQVAGVDLAAAAGASTRDPIVTFFLGFVLAMLFYMAALMFGQQISTSVVEEKQSRLVEVLAAMIPLRHLLAGKVLGNTLIAFGQILLISVVAIVGLRFTTLSIDLTGLTTALLWYVAFFVVGFLALASLYAVAGALASRNEDLAATTMPMTIALVIVLIVGLQATGTLQQVLSFLPIASTVVMPLRILDGDYALWEPIVALLLVLTFCAVAVWLGARLYERAVMHTTGTLTWRQALRLTEE
ncbi:ABC transporter permease [Kribbia dieselivorans]|uniref:ABC transporter permease n=1 Tax=Kribbia dieselivorans TaxID=331526 RepID=UPI000838A7CC|nr:ABC transporter permease [Kribbia dieselivorans]